MANVSANNFLNLLFGGAQQGIGEFRRQQGQQTDLLLTLQNMLQQRQNEVRRRTESDRAYQFGVDRARAHDQQFLEGLKFDRERAATAESERLRASTRQITEKNQAALKDLQQTDRLIKLAEKYPELGPAIDAALAGAEGLGGALIGGLMAKEKRLGPPTREDKLKRQHDYLQLWARSPETAPVKPDGTVMSFGEMRQYAAELVERDYGNSVNPTLESLQMDDIDAMIEQTRQEILKMGR